MSRSSVAGRKGTPAELVAEGAVEAVAGKADHGEGGLAAADGDPVARPGGEPEPGRRSRGRSRFPRPRDHLVAVMAALHQRALGERVRRRAG